MGTKGKLLLVNATIGTLAVLLLLLWIGLIFSLASSGLPMLRQLLGCMLSTMAIFALLSFSLRSLKQYRDLLKERL